MTLIKQPLIRSDLIRRAAKGENCTMQSYCCNHDPLTTVAAHSNLSQDGKGFGQKSSDIYIAFLCSNCHDIYDGRVKTMIPKEELQEMFHYAMKKTWARLIELGIIQIKGAKLKSQEGNK